MKHLKLFENNEHFWVGEYVICKRDYTPNLQGVCVIVDIYDDIAAIENLRTRFRANRGLWKLRKALDHEVEAEKYNL